MSSTERSASGAAPLPVVGPDGRLPLPWLQGLAARAAAMPQAHALLLHGVAGIGHLQAAVVLAQGLLCEAPAAAASLQACGHCTACRQVAARSHPDLRLVLPGTLRAAQQWTDEDDWIAPRGDAKPSKELRIDQLRMAIDWAQRTSARGRGKVLVLHPADAMNLASANALLKTLEEPPGRLKLVLTTVDAERLLPTVRSRCQRLAIPAPTPQGAHAWLQQQGLPDPQALLALAGGSPLEALAWAAEGLTPAWLAGFPARVAGGDAAPLAGRPVPRVVELLLKLCHDLQVRAAGGSSRFFATANWPPAAVDLERLLAWQQALQRTARHDEHAWNAPLLVEALVSQAQGVWVAPAGAPGGGLRASLHSAR